jgi:hypothetical protein
MISLLLLGAHMLGDYVLQTHQMSMRKLTDARVRTQHVLLYTLAFVPVVLVVRMPYWRAWAFLGLVFVTHWITDSRRWASGAQWPPKPILVDQTIHITTLAVLGVVFGLR